MSGYPDGMTQADHDRAFDPAPARPDSVDVPGDERPASPMRPHGWANPDQVLNSRLIVAHNRLADAMVQLSVAIDAGRPGVNKLPASPAVEIYVRSIERELGEIADSISKLNGYIKKEAA